MVIDFIKMSGAGNDFVLIDNRDTGLSVDWSKAAPEICDRHYGIGADGLLVLTRHEKDDFAMAYYNADGSSGSMCGNGGRCAAYFYLEGTHQQSVHFYSNGYTYSGSITSAGEVRVQMKDPGPIRKDIGMDVLGHRLRLHFIDTGSPHAVIFTDDLPEQLKKEIEGKMFFDIAKAIRHSPEFMPDGVNVNFIRIRNNRGLSMRTYERGVEDETLACGTGSIACAIVAHAVKGIQSPVDVQTRGNERLEVSFDSVDGKFSNVSLGGPAKVIFKGQYSLKTNILSTESNRKI